MSMSESLADGLKNRFFRDMENAYFVYKRNLSAIGHKKLSVNSLYKSLWQASGGSGLLNCEGGSKRKSFFYMSYLMPLESRPFNSWREKCLFGNEFYFCVAPKEFNSEYSCFCVGEHAVKRVFQRVATSNDENLYKADSVYFQMKYLPLWANFIFNLFGICQDIGDDDAVSVEIPAPDGIWIAQYSKKSCIVEVRTFVGLAMLSDKQRWARDGLIEISEILYKSPASFRVGSKVLTRRSSYFGLVLLATFFRGRLAAGRFLSR